MRRLLRRRWVIGAALLLGVVGAGYLLGPAGGMSHSTFDRIEIGWTRTQVVSLLRPKGFTYENAGDPTWIWYNDDDGGTIILLINAEGRVSNKRYLPSDLSFFDLCQRRIERRLRALRP
jgi:hypothetical protein